MTLPETSPSQNGFAGEPGCASLALQASPQAKHPVQPKGVIMELSLHSRIGFSYKPLGIAREFSLEHVL